MPVRGEANVWMESAQVEQVNRTELSLVISQANLLSFLPSACLYMAIYPSNILTPTMELSLRRLPHVTPARLLTRIAVSCHLTSTSYGSGISARVHVSI
jgi:hypothetical protein